MSKQVGQGCAAEAPSEDLPTWVWSAGPCGLVKDLSRVQGSGKETVAEQRPGQITFGKVFSHSISFNFHKRDAYGCGGILFFVSELRRLMHHRGLALESRQFGSRLRLCECVEHAHVRQAPNSSW